MEMLCFFFYCDCSINVPHTYACLYFVDKTNLSSEVKTGLLGNKPDYFCKKNINNWYWRLFLILRKYFICWNIVWELSYWMGSNLTELGWDYNEL